MLCTDFEERTSGSYILHGFVFQQLTPYFSVPGNREVGMYMANNFGFDLTSYTSSVVVSKCCMFLYKVPVGKVGNFPFDGTKHCKWLAVATGVPLHQ